MAWEVLVHAFVPLRARWPTHALIRSAGKTQLALTFAFEQRPKYSGVFFMDADTESTLHAEFSRIHDELELGCPKDKVGAVKRWFDMDDDVNWLLIFDNADQLGSYRLTDYFPLSRNSHIILTSRDPSSIELASDGIQLEMMKPEESKALLLLRAGLATPSEKDLLDVARIVEDLSHLPLAIDQAGAYRRTRKCSPAAYIRLFKSQRERVLKFSPKLSSYNKSVITAWEMSFLHLEARGVGHGEAVSDLLLPRLQEDLGGVAPQRHHSGPEDRRERQRGGDDRRGQRCR